jgi:hypothetical protein
MSVTQKTKSTLAAVFGARALVVLTCGISSLPACSVFAARNQSTVAQGKYYAAGDPHYDEFFVGLFLLQVQMDQAPHVPELERLNLAHALALTPGASNADVAQRLHEEALKLSRSGLRMRLDQNASSEKPDAASAALKTSGRPKDRETTNFLAQVETSATALLRSAGELKQATEALDGLELAAGGLDASVDKDFASAPVGKLEEVKKNLADAHRLVALMKVRAQAVQGESEQLLTMVSKAVNTDDGSLGAPGTEPASEAAAEATKAEANGKKPVAKPKPKTVAAGAGSAPAPAAAKPKLKAAPAADGDEPAKAPPKAAKPPPPPRDFEP